MIEFGAQLPKLRRRLKQDLALPGLPKHKVLAVIVTLVVVIAALQTPDLLARVEMLGGLAVVSGRVGGIEVLRACARELVREPARIRHRRARYAAARSANFAYRFRKESFSVPVGPLRCLARCTSASPCDSDSSL
jgi:hypothetical protein